MRPLCCREQGWMKNGKRIIVCLALLLVRRDGFLRMAESV
jgi:hypothetical protein